MCSTQGEQPPLFRLEKPRHAELRTASQAIYREFTPRFGEALIEGIREA